MYYNLNTDVRQRPQAVPLPSPAGAESLKTPQATCT